MTFSLHRFAVAVGKAEMSYSEPLDTRGKKKAGNTRPTDAAEGLD